MPEITLFEFEPTRSLKCRWALYEAGLDYTSVGNDPKIIGSDELRKIHPLGKLPAAIIKGKPLFESSAITTAIADLAPAKSLVGTPGSWERTLHDQWTCYALAELELWAWGAMLNAWDIFIPAERRVPAIIEQNRAIFRRGAVALDAHLIDNTYMVDDRFSVTDINVAYAANLGRAMGFLDGDFGHVNAYLDRLYDREQCTLGRPA